MKISSQLAHEHPGTRDESAFSYGIQYHRTMSDFKDAFIYSSSSHSIALKKTSLDIELHLKKIKQRTLIVFFGGAKIREQRGKPGPFFMGRKIAKSIEANSLFISDPSFAYKKNVRLGWYLGTKYDLGANYIVDLINFIKNITEAERIIFVGGSGGGFASLLYNTYFPESLSFVWNPQIILKNYIPGVVNEYLSECFDCSIDSFPPEITSDLAQFYNTIKNKNKIIYWQNISDHHVEQHLSPFFKKNGLDFEKKLFSDWINNWLYLHLTDSSERHEPPPKLAIARILQGLVNLESFSDFREIKRMVNEIDGQDEAT